MNSQYERLKAKGVDMRWYEKSNGYKPGKHTIPLSDDLCYRLSVYFLDKSGRLFTTKDGLPYMQVRQLKKPAVETYICVCCKQLFNNYVGAIEHYDKQDKQTKS